MTAAGSGAPGRPDTPGAPRAEPAQLAKATLRRLATAQIEPTPENYARAWAEELGEALPPAGLAAPPDKARPVLERLAQRASDDPALRSELAQALAAGRWDDLARLVDRSADLAEQQAQAWSLLIGTLTRALDRSTRQWTAARRKESVQRVLDGSGRDLTRLQQRLRQLVTSWDQDGASAAADAATEGAAPETPAPAAAAGAAPATLSAGAGAAHGGHWPPVVTSLEKTVIAAMPADEPRAGELADQLTALAAELGRDGATPALVERIDQVCDRARRLFAHRHHLVEQLSTLCRELTAGLGELAEDGSWAQGQMRSLEARLDGGVNARSVKAASELLARTRQQHQTLRSERDRARDALREMVQGLLAQLGELGDQTGRYGERLGRYSDAIGQASSIDQLSALVQDMLADNRAVQSSVVQSHAQLATEHARAGELESRVRELEGELRRLSDEVSTDVLTQVANRRGLLQAFETERARLGRATDPVQARLAIGLIDIDNFKKLNDTLGHAAGDVALKSLAQRVRDGLRPVDVVARYGGEEFVVLLPATPVDEAQQVLTRLQRALTASLFMHDGHEVFVTFSAGVTAYRAGETIEAALERADEALYEAKRTGKNRTCIG